MEYSNKHELNKKFHCVLCGRGEHGIGKNNKFVCFNCINELVSAHDLIVKQQFKIQIKE